MTTPPPHRPTATAAGGRGATGPESSAGPPAGIGADRIRVAADAPRPGGFVRTAAAADLETMGRVHASTMLASLSAAHADAHNGAGLPASVTAMIAAPVIAAGWE
ncbi:MAG: GNAT family N-acetyltransferase, partial [Actinomyces sp.]